MRRTVIAVSIVLGALQVPSSGWAAPPREARGLIMLSPAAALREGMRELWSDHAIWTREYIVAAVAGGPDQAAAAGRLMKNQEDIGAAIAPYYGEAAGVRLTVLLKEHITIAVGVVAAAKAGDTATLKRAEAEWHRNGADIATFLSQANPNWPRNEMLEMMNMHLATTTNEVVARLTGDWEGDARAFDEVYRHLLHMSDMLADGIVLQFPNRFGRRDAKS